MDDPFGADGGLKVLSGNLGRAVIKTSAVQPQHRVVEALNRETVACRGGRAVAQLSDRMAAQHVGQRLRGDVGRIAQQLAPDEILAFEAMFHHEVEGPVDRDGAERQEESAEHAGDRDEPQAGADLRHRPQRCPLSSAANRPGIG